MLPSRHFSTSYRYCPVPGASCIHVLSILSRIFSRGRPSTLRDLLSIAYSPAGLTITARRDGKPKLLKGQVLEIVLATNRNNVIKRIFVFRLLKPFAQNVDVLHLDIERCHELSVLLLLKIAGLEFFIY